MSTPSAFTLVMGLLIWCGVCVGANLVAAPAKFQVVELSRPLALLVGRAQFLWVGYVELFFSLWIIVAALALPRSILAVSSLPVVILFVQRFVILPRLSLLTDQVVAGGGGGGSGLHLIYVACEIIKILTIFLTVWLVTNTLSQR